MLIPRCVLACVVVLIVSGCASYAGRDLVAGSSTEAELVAQMGAPAERWKAADGSLQLAYPRGPEGPHTFMAFFQADGRLVRIENVLTERHFAQIVPGMSKEDVLRRIGPSQPQWTAFFAARDELVWEWRYCDYGGQLALFDVLFDGTTQRVRSTLSRPDYRGPDGVVPPCAQVWGR